MGHFKRLLQTLVDHPDLKVEYTEGASVVDTQQNTQVELEEGGDPDEDFVDSGVTQLTGSVLSYLERLDDEFYKSLQALDPHQQEYITRLKDEVPLVNLMLDTLAYYDSQGMPTDSARVAARVVEHVYYREQQLFDTAAANATTRKAMLLKALGEAAKYAEAAEEVAVAAEERAAEEDEDEDEESDSDEDEPKAKPELPRARLLRRHRASQDAHAALPRLPPRAARPLPGGARPAAHVAPGRHHPPVRHLDADPVQPRHRAVRHLPLRQGAAARGALGPH